MHRKTIDAQNHVAALLLPEFLVPTVRLELTQLAPLPPQDSVSTNFTTSAISLLRERRELYNKPLTRSCAATKKSINRDHAAIYFGMSLAFESGTAGVCTGAAGTLWTGAESITLPDARGLEVAI